MDIITAYGQCRKARNKELRKINILTGIVSIIVLLFIVYLLVKMAIDELYFSDGFFIGMTSIGTAILLVATLSINVIHKRTKYIFVVDNINDTFLQKQIKNTLASIDCIMLHDTTNEMKVDNEKKTRLLKRMILDSSFVFVLRDDRPLTQLNKDLINYANKKRKLIKWSYKAKGFKFDSKPSLGEFSVAKYYLASLLWFVIVVIQYVLVDCIFNLDVNNLAYQAYTMILSAIISLCIVNKVYSPIKKRLIKKDISYINWMELKK